MHFCYFFLSAANDCQLKITTMSIPFSQCIQLNLKKFLIVISIHLLYIIIYFHIEKCEERMLINRIKN